MAKVTAAGLERMVMRALGAQPNRGYAYAFVSAEFWDAGGEPEREDGCGRVYVVGAG